MIEAYPLTWPVGFPRTTQKLSSRFNTTVAAALKNVNNSLVLFGKDSETPTKNIVISSNVTLGNTNPKDSGVAVWFDWEGKQLCIAVDRYNKVEENLQAIYHIIESRRTELRHGGLHLLRQAFSGFKALPAARGSYWWDILQCKPDASKEVIVAQYKRLAKDYHPDKPTGSDEKMTALNKAYQEAFK